MSTFISYFDETGDDGFPQRSSDLFVLTSVSMNTLDWKENYNLIADFRKQLKTDYGIPKKVELHTKNLIMNKKPYRFFGLEENQIKDILTLYAQIISDLKIQIVNVVINKSVIKMRNYPVLHNALTYNIQRIENTLNNLGQDNKFVMITDEGRIGKMVKTVKINPYTHVRKTKEVKHDRKKRFISRIRRYDVRRKRRLLQHRSLC